ncbi:threonine-phosphate decarboxylase CobD [Aminobacter ciceronei]|uniref:threonine-phosphate decarboxylase n=1 Tax=Aminobacter ciceronei TaxID=150723 RepID=A0ABR6C9R0_9HYPH|nr:threonine-phosphate decarboxylase CobD [Aminobacter ciceronei]MBA8907983.1 cobalamin biosynthetic protein CobC [Aminobacter ciceronei]MBA9021738.1 cobalamin biosynthetic protein CobC [Aminobacter ciceronei]
MITIRGVVLPGLSIVDHGGNLSRAQQRFPFAPRPWLDLSTGINACPYPAAPVSSDSLLRLPEEADLLALAASAARAYGAKSASQVVCAPGTQILLPIVAGNAPPGRAAVLSPTYAEHCRAAALCGHVVTEVTALEDVAGYDIVTVVNPNNPDGRVTPRATLLEVAQALRSRNGLLVVDEAFMDVGPQAEQLDGDVEGSNIVVLRSFGKFFGLAGIRLGFAVCGTAIAASIRGRLGPWAVSGPALSIGRAALDDAAWQERMRANLNVRAARLDSVLAASGFLAAGGTCLYRYVRHPAARRAVEALGRRGVLVRSFDFEPDALRFGVPSDDGDFERLATALAEWRAES